jgi:Family of unknown function (DUF5906)
LRQNVEARRPRVFDGDIIDTMAAVPPLSADERRRYDELVGAAKVAMQPDADRMRAAYIAARVAEMVSRGVAEETARRNIQHLCNGVLLPETVLPWDDRAFAGKTVADVLRDPDRFVGETLADPIEGIDYGRGKAKVYCQRDGAVNISSLAHGLVSVYRLRYDMAAAEATVSAAVAKEAADRMVRCVMHGDLSAIEVEQLIDITVKHSGFGKRVLKNALKDARQEAEQAGKRGAKAAGLTRIGELNRAYAVMNVKGKVLVLYEHRGSTGRPEFSLMNVAGFRTWMLNKPSVEEIAAAEYWLEHPNRREYAGLVFNPGREAPGFYNLWRGFAYSPSPGSCQLFLEHIKDNICNGDTTLYNWVIGWYADIFQHPGKKCGTALVYRGPPGVGKSIVNDTFGKLLGDHYVPLADQSYLTGSFNAHLVQCLLLHAEEAFWAGDKRAEGKLKDLVTSQRHAVQFKYVDINFVDNHIRLAISSNETWAVPAAMSERRFAVIDVGKGHMQDIPYFAKIDAELQNGGYEALLDYLLNFDLSAVNLRVIPKTAALLEQKIESMPPLEKWWIETLVEGRLPGGCYEQNSCPAAALFDRFLTHAKITWSNKLRPIQTQLGMFLKKMTNKGMTKSRQTYQTSLRDEYGYVYNFPALSACREEFEKQMQQTFEWEEGIEGGGRSVLPR